MADILRPPVNGRQWRIRNHDGEKRHAATGPPAVLQAMTCPQAVNRISLAPAEVRALAFRVHTKLMKSLAFLIALGLLAGVAGHAAAAPSPPEVQLDAGRVRGAWADGIAVFRGIPYGADTATTRFGPPQPVARWSGVRAALDFGPVAPRHPAGGEAVGLATAEDCLNLNVWTPAPDAGRRPVLVYFHGGAYAHGTVNHALYDGARLAARGDVVVVTVNHRLNGFGYLDLEALDATRFDGAVNAGQLDLVLALRWVAAHASRFGGDPARVTVFGQSGGGAKIATLMAMPAAQGLFHRAWTMSGQQITGRTREAARRSAREVLARLGLDAADTASAERRLRSLPADTLAAAFDGGRWAPVVDGEVLPADPFEPEAPRTARALPMVIGNVRDETTSLIGAADPATFALDWPQVAPALRRHVSAFLGGLDADDVVARYRRWYPGASASDVFFAASTAARSWKSMLVAADRRAAQRGPTWVYYVHWRTPADGGRWRAPHTLDIPLLFGNLEASAYTREAQDAARPVAEAMADALVAFARSGDPNAEGRPTWPRYRLPRREAMVFDARTHVESDPRGVERRLFAPIEYVQPGTRD
jgi:para-nitrobenzyl esterase